MDGADNGALHASHAACDPHYHSGSVAIQPRGGFIHKHDSRVCDQLDSDGQALALQVAESAKR